MDWDHGANAGGCMANQPQCPKTAANSSGVIAQRVRNYFDQHVPIRSKILPLGQINTDDRAQVLLGDGRGRERRRGERCS